MPQLFSHRADRLLRGGGVVVALLLVLGLVAGLAHVRSDRAWDVGRAAPQPVPFSHAVHAGGLGLDCRFCHARVETAASAGMPAAETCLGCHDAVWAVSAQLAPLRTALALGAPASWASVHRLPDHVRFHHGAHVAAGLACTTCHGAVETMSRTVKTETLSMGWCLECHRAQPAVPVVGHEGVAVSPLTRCSVCHR